LRVRGVRRIATGPSVVDHPLTLQTVLVGARVLNLPNGQEYFGEPFKSQVPRSVGPFSLLLNDKLAPKREGTNRVVYGGEEAKQLFLH
jgi:hypothetical protein